MPAATARIETNPPTIPNYEEPLVHSSTLEINDLSNRVANHYWKLVNSNQNQAIQRRRFVTNSDKFIPAVANSYCRSTNSNIIFTGATIASVLVTATSNWRSRQAIKHYKDDSRLVKQSSNTAENTKSIARGANDPE